MPATPYQSLLSEANCYLCLGISMADAMILAEWSAIASSISPTPPVEGFFILAESGDTLAAENNDLLEVESAP